MHLCPWSMLVYLQLPSSSPPLYCADFDMPRPCRPLETIETVFKVNTLGPIIVLRAFLPLLNKGSKKTVIHIFSGAGSTGNHAKAAVGVEPAPLVFSAGLGYACSKAALNMGERLLMQ